jgi:hypothetical protein
VALGWDGGAHSSFRHPLEQVLLFFNPAAAFVPQLLVSLSVSKATP